MVNSMNITYVTGPSGFSVTGGTALAVSTETDLQFARMVPTADTDFRTRRQIVLSMKDPKVNVGAPSGFSQQRSDTVGKFPLVLDNGKTTSNGFSVNLHFDVETTDAEKTHILDMLAQTVVSADWRAAVKSNRV